jgi:chitodextrinase
MKIGFWFFGIVFISVFFLLHTSVFAVTSSAVFKVRAFIGVDTTPPTVPVLQSVAPVAPTQIDITWLPSTDDVLLIGYQLFRDGIQIATTSQTSFNDSGLIPETMYTYTVDAYDSFDNVSSTSAPMATTTPPVPVPPPATSTPTSTGSPRVSSTMVTILHSPVEVIPSQRSAVIKWQTNTNTRYTIVWGRTPSYELGSVSTNAYKQSNETTIENLEPGTHYWYSITVTDGSGVTGELQSSDFVTLPAFQSTLPPNVSNVQAIVHGSDVSLIWQNPELAEGDVVRVVRSPLFYPISPTDGAIVYEGRGTNVGDLGALAARSPQYYSIFVVDRNGAVSSGAVVSVSSGVPTPARSDSQSATTSTATSSETASSTGSDTTESGPSVVLGAEGVYIRQGSVTQLLAMPITLDAEQLYTVYIPINAVAPHIKSIIVTVQDPTDQRLSTSYLLKLNQNGDAYEAVVQAPRVVGASRMTVEVFDYYQASIRRISTTVVFTSPRSLPVVFPDDIVHGVEAYALPATGTVAGVGVLWWSLFFWRRRREDNN